jgi:predicted O-linked N-acetylglucosamine transferase (SPINDLY family)
MFAWLRRRTKADVERRIGAAIAHHEAGRLDAAQAGYEEILRDDPRHVDGLHFLGFLAFQRGRHERAVELISGALALNAAQPRAHQNLGNALQALGRHAEAAASFERAAALAPELLEAHYNLGIARRALGERDAAAAAFRAALRVDPACAEAHYALGQLAADADQLAQAQRCFRHALALRPDYAEARWSLALCHVPQVYGIGEDPGRARADLAAALGELEAWCEQAGERAADGVGAMQPFSLAYDEAPNRALLERYGTLCGRVMARAHRPVIAAHAGRPLRIGVVSAQLRDHSVWHALVKGWFGRLDRERFELHAFHLGTAADDETRFAKAAAARFVEGARDTAGWIAAIAESRPDVLIYPEVGMDPMTARLAALRLARVQAASWGHPETTGLPTIDYYLSAAALEPPQAQANYREKLVLLPGLGCHFEPRRAPSASALDVPGDGPLLVCPGVPFKYAPRYDWVLGEIARRLGSCRMVFFEHPGSARLRERLRALDLERHARFLPWLSKAQFHALLARADLALDTIGFSGFNTALQAIEAGLPMVTREGRFLRGRLASGILRRLGLDELVSATEEEYVERAVALARDAGARERLRAAMAARRDSLYRDPAPLRALEEFLYGA